MWESQFKPKQYHHRTPMRRRTTGQITQQKSYENIPMSKGMYEEAQDVSKGIYRVTIKASGDQFDWGSGTGLRCD